MSAPDPAASAWARVARESRESRANGCRACASTAWDFCEETCRCACHGSPPPRSPEADVADFEAAICGAANVHQKLRAVGAHFDRLVDALVAGHGVCLKRDAVLGVWVRIETERAALARGLRIPDRMRPRPLHRTIDRRKP